MMHCEANLPNNPPRWEEGTDAVIQLTDAWRNDAKPEKRMKAWINRIGWDRFFKKTGVKVSLKDMDGYLYGSELARSDLRFGW